MTTADKYRKTLAWLRKTFPPVCAVEVRSVDKLKGAYAQTAESNPGGLVLTIDRRHCWGLVLDAMIHEWAHILTWSGFDMACGIEHGPEFGVAYANIYRTFMAWNYGRRSTDDT